MNRDELMDVFNRTQRMHVDWPGMVRMETNGVIRHYAKNGDFGFIAYSALDENTVEATIQQEIDFFTGLGRGFEWKVFDSDRPADLKERLQARGFEIEEPEALMVMELTTEHPLIKHPVPPEIRRVTSEAEVDALVVMEEAVWKEGRDWLGKHLKEDLVSMPDRLSVYAAWQDGRVVSAAWIYYHPGTPFGSLWGGSTLEEYRKRGLYTGLLAVRAQEAWKRGYSLLYVDASPMSQPILEKHGFLCLGFSTPCNFELNRE